MSNLVTNVHVCLTLLLLLCEMNFVQVLHLEVFVFCWASVVYMCRYCGPILTNILITRK